MLVLAVGEVSIHRSRPRASPSGAGRSPKNTSDRLIIKKVKDDLAGWMLCRVVWVADSGFNLVANRAYVQASGGRYVVAERVRGGSKEAQAALARPGCFSKVVGNLEVKEMRVRAGAHAERFVISHNLDVAARD